MYHNCPFLFLYEYAAHSVPSDIQHLPVVQQETWPAGNVTITDQSLYHVSFLVNLDVFRREDIGFLVRELHAIAPKWQIFSVQLGVPTSELNIIAAKPMLLPGAPVTFLQDALNYWICDAHLACTLNTLCDVLKSEVMGESTLAAQVEAKFWEYRRARGILTILY